MVSLTNGLKFLCGRDGMEKSSEFSSILSGWQEALVSRWPEQQALASPAA